MHPTFSCGGNRIETPSASFFFRGNSREVSDQRALGLGTPRHPSWASSATGLAVAAGHAHPYASEVKIALY